MNLEKLLREGIIRRIKPDHETALALLKRADLDIMTADDLLDLEDYDWALTVYYNAMLRSARALMLDLGYRPSSSNGHIAVVKFLGERMKGDEWETNVAALDRLRRKRHELVYEEPDLATKADAYQAEEWADKFIASIKKLVVKKNGG